MPRTNVPNRFLPIAALLLLALSMPSLAQTTGTIIGTVIDASNTPIAGAMIRLKNTKQGAIAKPNGRFVIKNVEAGTQTLVITGIGMVPYECTIKVAPACTTDVGNCVIQHRQIVYCCYCSGQGTPIDEVNQSISTPPQEIIQPQPPPQPTAEATIQ